MSNTDIKTQSKIFDVTRLVSRYLEKKYPTGIDRVVLAYLKHYRESAFALIRHRNRWLFLGKKDSQRLWNILLTQDKKLILYFLIIKAHLFNQKISGDHLFFNLSHDGLEKKSYGKNISIKKVNSIYFLHDLIPITHSEYSRPTVDQQHHRRLETMLKTGCGLILNSEATHNSLLNYAKQYQLKLPKIIVSPLGVETLPLPNQQRPLEAPYFVMLGTIESRKNHLLILNCWRYLIENKINPMPTLVIIGRRGWECEQAIDMLDRCASLQEYVIELHECDDHAVSTWLYHSQALLFPSFVEGYGLPLVEALSLSVPVIASNLTVFREIAGDIPEYINPIDGLGWCKMIEHYIHNDNLNRQAQLERLKKFNAWTWSDHFKIVDEFLNAK